MNLLLRILPLVLPTVIRWVEREERRILADGVPLEEPSRSDAAAMGVSHPERIRLLEVDRIPVPGATFLQALARILGYSTDQTAGMTLGYGIFIRSECSGNRHLIAHECVHTAQYERLGGVRPFLETYLHECLELGYPNSRLEQEAVQKSGELRS